MAVALAHDGAEQDYLQRQIATASLDLDTSTAQPSSRPRRPSTLDTRSATRRPSRAATPFSCLSRRHGRDQFPQRGHSHAASLLLMEQGDGVSRPPANHAALGLEPAASQARRALAAALVMHPGIRFLSIRPYRLTPKGPTNFIWPRHACRSSRIEMPDFDCWWI